jgi:hypothetical protein
LTLAVGSLCWITDAFDWAGSEGSRWPTGRVRSEG